MFKIKISISLLIFSSLLFGTSVIKMKLELKNIDQLNKKINFQEKDFNESQLDYFYLTSPSMIEKRIKNLDIEQYLPMEYSKIFSEHLNFNNLQNKYVSQIEVRKNKKKYF